MLWALMESAAFAIASDGQRQRLQRNSYSSSDTNPSARSGKPSVEAGASKIRNVARVTPSERSHGPRYQGPRYQGGNAIGCLFADSGDGCGTRLSLRCVDIRVGKRKRRKEVSMGAERPRCQIF